MNLKKVLIVKTKPFVHAIRISSIYLVTGLIYIYFSDLLVNSFIDDKDLLTVFQNFKGFGFVIITALILLLNLHKIFKDLQKEYETHSKIELKSNEMEGKYSLLFENSGEAILLTRPDGSIDAANPEACRIFGRTQQEIIQIGRNGLVDLNDERLKPALKERSLVGKFKGELNFVRKDGTIFPAEVSSNIFKDSKGQLLNSIIIKDITESKLAEEKIKKLNLELEQRVAERTKQLREINQELETFAYSVSHDLRAPLRHVDGFIDLLKKNLSENTDEKTERYFSIIKKAINQMATLIDDLLMFSRISRKEINRSELDLNSIVINVLEKFQDVIDNKNIKITVSDLPVVKADAMMMNLVFQNLISNAIKFTSKKGNPEIKIGSFKENKNDVIFVKDNGAGFDMNYYGKIFGVFQRLHHSDEFEGSGIGLAHVKRIISKHGGKIWAEAIVNEGASFYFYIPTK